MMSNPLKQIMLDAISEYNLQDMDVRNFAQKLVNEIPGNYYRVVKRLADFSRDPDPLLSMMLAMGTKYSILFHKRFLKTLNEREKNNFLMQKTRNNNRLVSVEDSRRSNWIRCDRNFVQHWILEKLKDENYQENFHSDDRRLMYYSCQYDVDRYFEIDFGNRLEFRVEVPRTEKINVKPQALFNNESVFEDVITAILEPSELMKDVTPLLSEIKEDLRRRNLLDAFQKISVIKQGNILQGSLIPQRKDVPYFNLPRSLINCFQGIKGVDWTTDPDLSGVLSYNESQKSLYGIESFDKLSDICTILCRLMMDRWSGMTNPKIVSILKSIEIKANTRSLGSGTVKLTRILESIQFNISEEVNIIKAVIGLEVQNVSKMPFGTKIYSLDRDPSFMYLPVSNSEQTFMTYCRKGKETFTATNADFIVYGVAQDNKLVEIQCNFISSKIFKDTLLDILLYIDWLVEDLIDISQGIENLRENIIREFDSKNYKIFTTSLPESYYSYVVKTLFNCKKKNLNKHSLKYKGKHIPICYFQFLSVPNPIDRSYSVGITKNNITFIEKSNPNKIMRLYRSKRIVTLHLPIEVDSSDEYVVQFLHPKKALRKCINMFLYNFRKYWSMDQEEIFNQFSVLKGYILGVDREDITDTLGRDAINIRDIVETMSKQRKRKISENSNILSSVHVDKVRYAIFSILGTKGDKKYNGDFFSMMGGITISLTFNSGTIRRSPEEILNPYNPSKIDYMMVYKFEGSIISGLSEETARGLGFLFKTYSGPVNDVVVYSKWEDLNKVQPNDLFFHNDEYYTVTRSCTVEEENMVAIKRAKYINDSQSTS